MTAKERLIAGYANLVKDKKMTLEQVPAVVRSDVQQEVM